MKGKTTHWLIRDQTSTLSYRRKRQDYKGIFVVSNIIILLLYNKWNVIIPFLLSNRIIKLSIDGTEEVIQDIKKTSKKAPSVKVIRDKMNLFDKK